MTWIADELARAEKIKAERAAWTPAEIQANLDKAAARYATYGTAKHAYNLAAARDQVATTPFLVWIHARGEWERLNEKFQAMLKEIRDNDGEWDIELEASRYHASKATEDAYIAVEAQAHTAHIEQLKDRPPAWPPRMVAPHLRCAELRAEWRENGGV